MDGKEQNEEGGGMSTRKVEGIFEFMTRVPNKDPQNVYNIREIMTDLPKFI